MKKTARNIYLALILILMYAPIVTLMILSFNASKSRSKWGGFTLKWYGSLFKDDASWVPFTTLWSLHFYRQYWQP